MRAEHTKLAKEEKPLGVQRFSNVPEEKAEGTLWKKSLFNAFEFAI
ncbi:MAG: hypothetical protein H6557_27815 [Lewinellaceae bacterium]|nr:hypothetical protein [Lewinellaceae bacterium]